MLISPDDFIYTKDPETGENKYVWTPERAQHAWRKAFYYLHQALKKPNFKKVVLLVGIPGAGKSTWLKANHEQDAIYIDATFTNRKNRKYPIELAKAAGKRVEAVIMDTPIAVCLERNNCRTPDRKIPEDRVIEMAVELTGQMPSLAEGFDNIIRVHGKTASGKAELHIYDFDGTLFRSPDLAARWSGWWSEEVSLNPPCVPDKPDAHWWNQPVFAEARRSISNPNAYAVLLTGRRDDVFRWRVPELLKDAGLQFDQVILSNGSSVPEFKAQTVKKLLSRYPFIEKVVVWDDTMANHLAMRKVVEAEGLEYGLNRVRVPSVPVDCDVEIPSQTKKPKATYSAIFLDGPSRKRLESWWETNVGSFLDELAMDHVTLLLKPTAEQLAALPLGEEIQVKVTGWAGDTSIQAVAIELPAGLEVTSKLPHITISHADGVSPSQSIQLLQKGLKPVSGPVLTGRVGWQDGSRPVYQKAAAETKIDPAWVKGLRAWIKKTFVPKASYNSLEDLIAHLKQLKNKDLNRLFEYLFYTKGLLPTEDKDSGNVIETLRVKVREELKAARELLDDTLSRVEHTLQAMTPGSHTHMMDGGHLIEFYTRINPEDPFKAARLGYEDVTKETLEKVEGILSGKLLRAVSSFLTQNVGGLPFTPDEILLEFNIGKVKLIYDGVPDKHLINRPESRNPRGLEEYIPYFKKAQALLERKGFSKLWYGPMFVECPSCGGTNQHGAHFGVGAHYIPNMDTISIFLDPKPYMVELLIHELGHRYYYRFMNSGDRRRFDSYFKEVAAVSAYGATDPAEDFAEVFEHFILGRDMTRDQIERFKAFLAGSDKMRSFTAAKTPSGWTQTTSPNGWVIYTHKSGKVRIHDTKRPHPERYQVLAKPETTSILLEGVEKSRPNSAWIEAAATSKLEKAFTLAEVTVKSMEKTNKTANLTGVVEAPHHYHPVKVEPPKAKREEYPFEGFIDFQGLQIDVENVAGSTRSGTSPAGVPWASTMFSHYGEIRGTEGVDGDKLDAYVGPNHDSSIVVVVHQHEPETGQYDEDKVMLGYDSIEEAIGAYKKQYDRPGFFIPGQYTAMPIGQFWRWVQDKKNKGKRLHKDASAKRAGHTKAQIAYLQHLIHKAILNEQWDGPALTLKQINDLTPAQLSDLIKDLQSKQKFKAVPYGNGQVKWEKKAGDVVKLHRGPVEKIHGKTYFLSNYWPDLMTTEEDPKLIQNEPKYAFLWVVNEDRKQVHMWRVRGGDEKVSGSVSQLRREVLELTRRNQLNVISDAEFRQLNLEMQNRYQDQIVSLKEWAKELESDYQKTVNEYAEKYAERVIIPKIERALDEVDSGVLPFGFRVNEHLLEAGVSVEEQKRNFVVTQIQMQHPWTVFEDDLRKAGIYREDGDSQAAQWAMNDIQDMIIDRFYTRASKKATSDLSGLWGNALIDFEEPQVSPQEFVGWTLSKKPE